MKTLFYEFFMNYFCSYMSGLYIHIPFCAQKCIYCDFYSVVNQKLQSKYVSALITELSLRKKEIDFNKINTIYIGGGTPSYLTHNDIHFLINSIFRHINKNQIDEFTFEVNPDDVTPELIKLLKEDGVNRISMGVQSFNDDELKIIRRRHNSKEAIDAFNIIRSEGIENISIDLIFGLPEQTLSSFKENVQKAVEINPDHISCYGLMYEPGTLLYKMREEGRIKECEDSLYINMYTLLTEILHNNGYDHYEISNYCKENKCSRHNVSYWKNVPYLGIGAGAHSYDGNVRRYNPDNIREYVAALNSYKTCYIEEFESFNEKHNDYIMTQLRSKWGITVNDYIQRFGFPYFERLKKICLPYIKSKEMEMSDVIIKLTEKGMLVSDVIFSDLFIIDD